jgi:manganese/zinc/iron transport system substrate-binding protein
MKGLYLIVIALIFTSCRLDEEPKEVKQKGPLHIVVTTGIIEDCLSHIVGDSADVSAIMGPGTDPHIYKPTPGDVELLDEADVIVSNGLHLEGKMADMLESYAQEKPVIVVADGLDEEDIIQSADFQDAKDPHIWFDTDIWMKGMKYLAVEIGKLDSNSAGYYLENYHEYKKEIDALNRWVEEQFEGLDEEGKVLVTSHDAFSYFGRKYGLEVKGIQGISTLSEVGLKEVANMVDFVRNRKIKSIFIETSTSDKNSSIHCGWLC